MGHVQPCDPPTLPILAQHSVWIPGVGESDSILFRSRKQVNNLSERDDPSLQVHSEFRRAAALDRNELHSVSDKHKDKWLCLDAIKSWLLSSAPTFFFFFTKCWDVCLLWLTNSPFGVHLLYVKFIDCKSSVNYSFQMFFCVQMEKRAESHGTCQTF